jgi:hypothetical protein
MRRIYESIRPGENKETRRFERFEQKGQRKIFIRNPINIDSVPTQSNRKKVLVIRQQLIEGTYDFDKRLNIALDKILEGLTT